MKISIIVPVYNVEEYLSKCLDSLLNQDINKTCYEIIIINDGSTDNSLSILEQYAHKNQNIKIISQKNKGPGAARNTGIRHAEGKYLMFVDSDDYIEVNCLSKLLNAIQQQDLELLRFNYEAVGETGNRIAKNKITINRMVYDETIVDGSTFLCQKLGWVCYVCLFLFDTSLIKKNDLYFNECIYFEDVEWLPKVLLKAERISSINQVAYFYLQREGSITRTANAVKVEKLYCDMVYIIKYLNVLKSVYNGKQVSRWFAEMISLSVISLFFNPLNFSRRNNLFNQLLKNKIAISLGSRFSYKQNIKVLLIKLHLINYSIQRHFSKRNENSISSRVTK